MSSVTHSSHVPAYVTLKGTFFSWFVFAAKVISILSHHPWFLKRACESERAHEYKEREIGKWKRVRCWIVWLNFQWTEIPGTLVFAQRHHYYCHFQVPLQFWYRESYNNKQPEQQEENSISIHSFYAPNCKKIGFVRIMLFECGFVLDDDKANGMIK